jgi:hypothetical protein
MQDPIAVAAFQHVQAVTPADIDALREREEDEFVPRGNEAKIWLKKFKPELVAQLGEHAKTHQDCTTHLALCLLAKEFIEEQPAPHSAVPKVFGSPCRADAETVSPSTHSDSATSPCTLPDSDTDSCKQNVIEAIAHNMAFTWFTKCSAEERRALLSHLEFREDTKIPDNLLNVQRAYDEWVQSDTGAVDRALEEYHHSKTPRLDEMQKVNLSRQLLYRLETYSGTCAWTFKSLLDEALGVSANPKRLAKYQDKLFSMLLTTRITVEARQLSGNECKVDVNMSDTVGDLRREIQQGFGWKDVPLSCVVLFKDTAILRNDASKLIDCMAGPEDNEVWVRQSRDDVEEDAAAKLDILQAARAEVEIASTMISDVYAHAWVGILGDNDGVEAAHRSDSFCQVPCTDPWTRMLIQRALELELMQPIEAAKLVFDIKCGAISGPEARKMVRAHARMADGLHALADIDEQFSGKLDNQVKHCKHVAGLAQKALQGQEKAIREASDYRKWQCEWFSQ